MSAPRPSEGGEGIGRSDDGGHPQVEDQDCRHGDLGYPEPTAAEKTACRQGGARRRGQGHQKSRGPVRPSGTDQALVDMKPVRLIPALACSHPHPQGVAGIRQKHEDGGDCSLHGHALGEAGRDGEGPGTAQGVGAGVAQEHLGVGRIEGQEAEARAGHRYHDEPQAGNRSHDRHLDVPQ